MAPRSGGVKTRCVGDDVYVIAHKAKLDEELKRLLGSSWRSERVRGALKEFLKAEAGRHTRWRVEWSVGGAMLTSEVTPRVLEDAPRAAPEELGDVVPSDDDESVDEDVEDDRDDECH